jgi:hypothetical protein
MDQNAPQQPPPSHLIPSNPQQQIPQPQPVVHKEEAVVHKEKEKEEATEHEEAIDNDWVLVNNDEQTK